MPRWQHAQPKGRQKRNWHREGRGKVHGGLRAGAKAAHWFILPQPACARPLLLTSLTTGCHWAPAQHKPTRAVEAGPGGGGRLLRGQLPARKAPPAAHQSVVDGPLHLLRQLAAGVGGDEDVCAAKELAVDVHLGEGGPLGKLLHACGWTGGARGTRA